MKSAKEIQEDIDAFFDKMSTDVPAADQPAEAENVDPLLMCIDQSSTSDETPASAEEEIPLVQAMSPELATASSELVMFQEPESIAGSDSSETLLVTNQSGSEESTELFKNATWTKAVPIANVHGDHGVSTDVDNSIAPDVTQPEEPFEGSDVNTTAKPSSIADSVLVNLTSLAALPTSESSTSAQESHPEMPPDPFLVLAGEPIRAPESRVADLDGIAPAPGRLTNSSEDMLLEGDEEEEGTIASLSRTDDHALTRLVNEIDGDNHTQGSPKVHPLAGGCIATATLAELYQKQGFVQRAIEIYRQLLERDPDNNEYKHKIEELSG